MRRLVELHSSQNFLRKIKLNIRIYIYIYIAGSHQQNLYSEICSDFSHHFCEGRRPAALLGETHRLKSSSPYHNWCLPLSLLFQTPLIFHTFANSHAMLFLPFLVQHSIHSPLPQLNFMSWCMKYSVLLHRCIKHGIRHKTLYVCVWEWPWTDKGTTVKLIYIS